MLEVNFYGTNCETDHTFSNTDKIMREKGFDLFDLSMRRYCVSDLPSKFVYNMAAQTNYGRIYQGDALYLIDPCKNINKKELPLDKVFNLACLYEIFGKPCHSAELILMYKKEIDSVIDHKILLNILTKEVNNKFDNYDDFINSFNNDPTNFYPKEK